MAALSWLTNHPVIGLFGLILAALGVEVARRRHAQAKLRAARQAALVRAVEAGEAIRKAERVRIEAERTGIAPEVIRAQIDAQEAKAAARPETADKNAIRNKWKGFRWPTQ